MRKFALLVLALASSAFAPFALAESRSECPQCKSYQDAAPIGKSRPVHDMFCVDFKQEGPMKVVFTILVGGKPKRIIPAEKAGVDRYCIGPRHANKLRAETAALDLCNGEKTVRFTHDPRVQHNLAWLLKHWGTPKGNYACLLGGKACQERTLTPDSASRMAEG